MLVYQIHACSPLFLLTLNLTPAILCQWFWSPSPVASQVLWMPSGMSPLSQPTLSINIVHLLLERDLVKIVQNSLS